MPPFVEISKQYISCRKHLMAIAKGPKKKAAAAKKTFKVVLDDDTDDEEHENGKAPRGKKGGGRKPANATKAKAIIAMKKRGAQTKPVMNQKQIFELLLTATTVDFPEKKVRKINPFPINKKSGSFLNKFGINGSEFREMMLENSFMDFRKKENLAWMDSFSSRVSAHKEDSTKKGRVEHSRKMAKAKERSSTPSLWSDMQGILKHWENLEKEV